MVKSSPNLRDKALLVDEFMQRHGFGASSNGSAGSIETQ